MTILRKTVAEPPFDSREALRYAACKTETAETAALLRTCWAEAQHGFVYTVCYAVLPLTIYGADCDFGVFSASSRALAAHLDGCDRVVIFAATAGVEIDRLITRYSTISPSKALMFQAIGTERIEAVCHAFCDELRAEYGALTTRFSPGYGDLPLDVQRNVFVVLDPQKHLGLTLCDSLLMSPTKSVTAFVGLRKDCDL